MKKISLLIILCLVLMPLNLEAANYAPRNTFFRPDGAIAYAGSYVTLTTRHRDVNGADDIAGCYLNVGEASLYYDVINNKLYLRNDADTNWIGGITPGEKGKISNSKCVIHCRYTKATKKAKYITVRWRVRFRSSFQGNKECHLITTDIGGKSSPVSKKGELLVKKITGRPFLNKTQRSLLKGILKTQLKYFISKEVITSSGLPLGAYKDGDRGRYGYSNSTEWGYSILSWIAAADVGRMGYGGSAAKIRKMLKTLKKLQNDPNENYNNLFYPFYYVTSRGGIDLAVPTNDGRTDIPSIDNALLYTSLLIAEGWAKINGYRDIENSAHAIREKMDFSVFTKSYKQYVHHYVDASDDSLSDGKWDVYSDEGGVMLWVAYLSGAVSFDEFKRMSGLLMKPAKTWDGITVEEAPWFGAMFAWSVRALAGFPIDGHTASFKNATKAHLAYGDWLGIDYPAFSDAMTQGVTGRYTPPNIPNQVPSDIPDHTMPHALFVPLCIGPDLDSADLTTLTDKIAMLKNDTADYYDAFGFEVTASAFENDTTYAGVEARNIYETLSQAYGALSIYHGWQTHFGKPTFYHYACEVPGYEEKVNEVLDYWYGRTPETLQVPQDHATIQEAIDAASPGDTVLVAPGTYLESVQISGKPKLKLKGTVGNYDDPLDATTNSIIDSEGDLVLKISTSANAVIDGLVLTGADRSLFGTYGGGIYNTSSDVVIKNNIIYKNKAASGAGILSSSAPRVLITENVIRNNHGHYGGGISISTGLADPESAAIISNNEIIDNYAWNSGGGIIMGNGYIIIENNLVRNNRSDWYFGIYASSANGIIRNNLIIDNYATYKSGGGITAKDSPLLIINNVIYRNRPNVAWGGVGGGIYVKGTIVPEIKNNIIGANYHCGIYAPDDTEPTLSYNNVYSQSTAYEGCSPGLGAISEDPQFVSVGSSDFHLLPGSLCINAGDPDTVYNDPDSTRNDIGAYGGPYAK